MIEWNDKQLIKNNLHLTINQLIDYFNGKYTRKEIKNFLSNNNLKCQKENINTRNKRNQITQRIQTPINHDYFKTWSHNMAYILGIWYADGCIYSNKGRGYYFSIKLHKDDKYLLQLILNEMNSLHKIYENNDNSAHITISSKTIYQDLISLGGREVKSLCITLPDIPNEYMHDFIRGYFDGDGSVYNVKGKRINTNFACGSNKFLQSLLQLLKKEAGIEGGSLSIANQSLTFGKKDSIKLGNYIYQNNPELYLLRKYEKFKQYL